jgi:hypothetical protein
MCAAASSTALRFALIAFALGAQLVFAAATPAAPPAPFPPATSPVHGLWVWKGPSIVADAHGGDALLQFCHAQGINQVYLAVTDHGDLSQLGQFEALIGSLHGANIRVEALLSNTDADEAGKHRDKLLDRVQQIVQFNRAHPRSRFDGIHLDIEPQQRPENKGPGNLRFLPGLIDAYRTVRAVATPAQMSVNADIQNKLLKGSLAQRRMLLSSLPRLTLMMYEVSSPSDGDSPAQKSAKAQHAAQQYLAMAYEGLTDPNLAQMAIALRTPDYGDLLPEVLQGLETSERTNPHYLGWARHAYDDTLKPAP